MPTDYKNMGKNQQGDPNIMKLTEVNKVRPLDNLVAGWRQHAIEHPSDSDQFAAVVCPGARSCPLCRKPVDGSGKQRFNVSRRFAANVWDYGTGTVKVLVGGPQIFDEFKNAATVGIDPSTCDWTIIKSGAGIKTEYEVVRHDAEPFTAAAITPDMLHDVGKYETPTSTEGIFEVLGRFGIDYDALTIPEYTFEEASALVMPYTKHKGLTIEQLLGTDQSYAEWMHGTKLEQGQLGDPVFVALQKVMEERGLVPALDDALLSLPEPQTAAQQATPAAAPVVTVNQAAPAATPAPTENMSQASANMVELVGPDGKTIVVPPAAAEGLLAAGFKRPEPVSVMPTGPAKMLIGGQMIEVPSEQVEALLAAGGSLVGGEPAPAAEPEPPKLPLPDEVVSVSVGGTAVDMPFAQGAQVVKVTPNAQFADPGVQAAFERSEAGEAANQAASPTPTVASATASTTGPKDAEKPFECDQCEAAYKTQGALTNHRNRVHGGVAEPQPSAVPAAVNGSGDEADVERVKNKIATAPFARDFTKLLALFAECTGKQNFADMTPDEVRALEVRLDQEIAAGA